MLDARIKNFFSEFQLCTGWAEEELQENFQKNTLFMREPRMTAKYKYCITVPMIVGYQILRMPNNSVTKGMGYIDSTS